jgi:hypothetical protein
MALITHDARLPQHAQMVRHLDHFFTQFRGDLADVPRTAPQTLDDPQSLGIGHRTEQPRAPIRFKKLITHRGDPRPTSM